MNPPRRLVAALPVTADALFLSQQAGPMVLVAPTVAEAERLEREIKLFAPHKRVLLFADWEVLPFEPLSPHLGLISERLDVLSALLAKQFDVLCVGLPSLLYRLSPPSYVAAHRFDIGLGTEHPRQGLVDQLRLAGYQPVSQVLSPGEYALRGAVVDVFPMGSAQPYRIEWDDDTLHSLRAFDTESQRTLFAVHQVRLLPSREYPTDEAALRRFRERHRQLIASDPGKSQLYQAVSKGHFPPGLEHYLPLFFEHTASLFDYLDEATTVVHFPQLEQAIEQVWQDIRSRHRLLSGQNERPLLSAEAVFFSREEFFLEQSRFPRLSFSSSEHAEAAQAQPLPSVKLERAQWSVLHQFLQHAQHQKVLIAADGVGRADTLSEVLRREAIAFERADNWAGFEASTAHCVLAPVALNRGFVWLPQQWAVITEFDLFGEHSTGSKSKPSKSRKRYALEAAIRDLAEIRPGEHVVHESHGIGRYLGLEHLDVGGYEAEFVALQYANEAKLYVPVEELSQISRYSHIEGQQVHLHELGSGRWNKEKTKALAQVRDTAAELLNLYARRRARRREPVRYDHALLDKFCDGFGFVPTPDQQAAVDAVLSDFERDFPADRLICGDVGFGKTEVALRAAAAMVLGGFQVAVLAPTTLLAEQHSRTFADRFSGWPVKLVELSRFVGPKEQKAALSDLASGNADIVIGTHRLLQEDIQFARLGLIVVDEEHRFGVRHKEILKKFKAEVDVISMSATPIPRSMSLSLEGLRDFSVIATPPEKRLSIKTFVLPYGEGVIREALLREIHRGGQAYVVHNQVKTLEGFAQKIRNWLPELDVAVAHGQMSPRELETIMRAFVRGSHQVLCCSTIIETGLDVPRANTIVIDRADHFGLAQLHQLRGRVGRSHHQAYAYLLVDEERRLTLEAEQRLQAIVASDELGSGFYLAMQDLEIRGAGEILGEAQSGQIQGIGFHLYQQLLERAVSALKLGKEPDLLDPIKGQLAMKLSEPALLPQTYCPDVSLRLQFYKRLSHAETVAEIEDIGEEIADRFGSLVDAAKNLVFTHHMRIVAKPLAIERIDYQSHAILFTFGPHTPVDAGSAVAVLVQHKGKMVKPNCLSFPITAQDISLKHHQALSYVRALSGQT